MKKVRDIFRKKGFRKGLPRFMNCLSARFSAGRGQDGRTRLFSRLNKIFSTAGAGARGMRPGRSGQSDCRERFLFSPAAPKKFGRATTLQIGEAHPAPFRPADGANKKAVRNNRIVAGISLFPPSRRKSSGARRGGCLPPPAAACLRCWEFWRLSGF